MSILIQDVKCIRRYKDEYKNNVYHIEIELNDSGQVIYVNEQATIYIDEDEVRIEI